MPTNGPRILITNDDGVFAPGLRHLWNALSLHAHVTVVAPVEEKSSTSLSITLRNPLLIERVNWGNEGDIWSISGTPADCVKLALKVILDHPPDLIVSGINRGSNSGRNVLYSGTVAAAIEGVLQGIPAIAFSCKDYVEPDYHQAGQYIPFIVKHVLEHPLPQGTLLNVNFPEKQHGKIRGVKMTRQGKECWIENPDKRIHPGEGNTYYWLGSKLKEEQEDEDCDTKWLQKGYVAAVPIHIANLTDLQHLESHREIFESFFPQPLDF